MFGKCEGIWKKFNFLPLYACCLCLFRKKQFNWFFFYLELIRLFYKIEVLLSAFNRSESKLHSIFSFFRRHWWRWVTPVTVYQWHQFSRFTFLIWLYDSSSQKSHSKSSACHEKMKPYDLLLFQFYRDTNMWKINSIKLHTFIFPFTRLLCVQLYI